MVCKPLAAIPVAEEEDEEQDDDNPAALLLRRLQQQLGTEVLGTRGARWLRALCDGSAASQGREVDPDLLRAGDSGATGPADIDEQPAGAGMSDEALEGVMRHCMHTDVQDPLLAKLRSVHAAQFASSYSVVSGLYDEAGKYATAAIAIPVPDAVVKPKCVRLSSLDVSP